MHSHLSCLVRFNQTQVSFPLWWGSFGQVWIQQSHSSTDQRTVLRRWRGVSVHFQMNSGTVEWMNQCFVSGSLAKRAVWKRTAPNQKSTFYLVQTKASELADFPGVNTPLNQRNWRCLRSACARGQLNVNNTNYVDYVLGYCPKWQKTVTQGEEILNMLLLFLLHTKSILVAS